jgi:hypothetical protein
MTNPPSNDPPGIAFEKLVAAMQARIDPLSTVAHDETIVDRLGHSRQFDVVIRGHFAGQKMLGVIECKDLKRRVGNPEVDAFVTKANDVNANFKVLMSRSGFTKPALEKCANYGIQALSLLEADPDNRRLFIGTRWTAEVTRWSQLSLELHFADPDGGAIEFSAEQPRINNKRILDGFTNYVLDHESEYSGFGWIVNLQAKFDVPQVVEVKPGVERLCIAVSFRAERICEQLEYRVGMNAEGFFNWNTNEATFPSGSTITTDGVPTDFTQWAPRLDATWKQSGFLEFHVTAKGNGFTRVDDALDLDVL